MRFLFFLEPVVFRHNPCLLQPHLEWLLDIAANSLAGGQVFALAANAELCRVARELAELRAVPLQCLELDPLAELAAHGNNRAAYAGALYGAGTGSSAVREALSGWRDRWAPDVAVLTSQNAYAERALAGTPMLRMELAPLPRVGHPTRFRFDPCGHQCHSVLELQARQILNLRLEGGLREQMLGLLQATRVHAARADDRVMPALAALDAVRGGHRVALLALQPPDWVSYEGAGSTATPGDQLMAWADALPPGWVGVPTYHPGWRLPASAEELIARDCGRLRFLPAQLSQGCTEGLLLAADGLVTLSSSVAMTALLWGLRVVVAGQSPYAGWCPRAVAALEHMDPFTNDQAASACAFLCHRYAHRADPLLHERGRFLHLVTQLTSNDDPGQWLLDMSDLKSEHLRSLFSEALFQHA